MISNVFKLITLLNNIRGDTVGVFHSSTTSKHINQFIDQYEFLKLNGENIYPLKNRKRKKLLNQFYINQKNEVN